MIKIWVDDIREKPKDYNFECKSTNETIDLLKTINPINIEVLDLDHDAGIFAFQGGDYIKILDWMIEYNYICPVRLHTGNPVGRDNMWRLMQRYNIPEYNYIFD